MITKIIVIQLIVAMLCLVIDEYFKETKLLLIGMISLLTIPLTAILAIWI